MSQNDFNIANQGFPATRADINSALQALASNSAGTAEPSTTYAYQFWYDETNELLKMRNSDNDAWITLAAFDQTNDEWEVRSAVIQAVDAAGVTIKTDDGTARVTVADDGNVGIGTSSPTTRLHIATAANTGLLVSSADETTFQGIAYNSNNDQFTVGTLTGHPLVIYTNNTERMRIDSNGFLYVGSTGSVSASGGDGVQIYNAANNHGRIDLGKTFSGNVFGLATYHNGTNVGGITYNNTSTAYNTTSDYRLKEDVQPMVGASDRVLALNPVNFAWKADGTRVDGFLAHEAQEIVPGAVIGTKDAMRLEQYEVEPALGEIYTPAQPATYDEEGVELTPATDEIIHSTDVEQPAELIDGQQWREITPAVMGEREVPEYQGIDQSKLVPLLTAALQEALQKIDALEARVTALGG